MSTEAREAKKIALKAQKQAKKKKSSEIPPHPTPSNGDQDNKNQKKLKNVKNKPKKAVKANTVSEDPTAIDLGENEKKKQKKLAQKLRKKQEKEAAKLQKESTGKTQSALKSEEKEHAQQADKKGEKQKENPKESDKKKVKDEKKQKQKSKDNKQTQKPEGKVRRDPQKEAATVFVGNLPVNTKRVQLVRLFSTYGPVDAIRFRSAAGKVLFKHKHRKEAGSLNAYVVLKDAETAEKALALHSTEFKGNHLRVTRATNESDDSHSQMEAKRTVFVGNLKYSATEEKLREIFSSCGELDYIRCLHDGEKGVNKGVAFVCFKQAEAVGLALELNETILDERPIHVERYSVKKLGAKKARDESAAVESKQQSGAKKRLDQNKMKTKVGEKQLTPRGGGDDNKKKKSVYHGVKVNNIKKKQKKNLTNQMQKLAKKIAPKVISK